jgi:ribonuclease HI
MEIIQYNVQFVPWWAIKFQALADFIIEWTNLVLRGIDELPDHWVMYFDGSYTLKGVGADIVLISPEGDVLKYAIQLDFLATNNITKYEGLVTGLRLAKDLGIQWLLIKGDSQLVAKQAQKEFNCNNEKMVEYQAEVHIMEKFFDGFKVRCIPRIDNRDADHLAWITYSMAPTPPDVIIEKLSKTSVKEAESSEEAMGKDLMVIDEPKQEPTYDWMHMINMFLESQPPSDDNAEVERIVDKSKQYHLIDKILFQWGTNGMMMKCISREEGIKLLRDIHGGICGLHSSWHSIIGKTFRHGFY